jgi:hypothetical protein
LSCIACFRSLSLGIDDFKKLQELELPMGNQGK